MTSPSFRHAARQLWASPVLTATLVLTLGLGIGVVTTIGSGANAMLFRPLPFAVDEARVVALFESQPALGKTWKSVSAANLRDWRAESRSFSDIAAYNQANCDVGGTERPERVRCAAAEAAFFRVLGVAPALGRAFAKGEDVAGADRVVVLSDRLWERRFGRNPNVLGQLLEIDGVARQVVGVLGPHVEFPEWAELWRPLVLDPSASRGERRFDAVARLRPNVTVAAAQAEMNGVARGLEARYPETNQGWGVFVRPLKDAVMPPTARAGVVALLGAVVLVLLLVCANVATLLLARAGSRRHEMSVRRALGATRFTLFVQVLAESLLLAALGGAAGVLAAAWGVALMRGIVPFEIPHWIYMDLDPRVLAFAACCSIGSGLLFGVTPAWHLSTSSVAWTGRKDAVATAAGRRGRAAVRHAMVVAQFAISLVLLIGAVLLSRSAWRVNTASPGFDSARLMTLRVSLHGAGYGDIATRMTAVEAVLRELRRMPGVEAAAATNHLPASSSGFASATFETTTRPDDERTGVTASINAVTADYQRTLGVPVVSGRMLEPAEVQRADRVAVISRKLADRLWPGRDPIGREMRRRGDPRPLKIVGVVADVPPPYQMKGVDAWPDAQAYVPISVIAAASTEPTIVVRASGEPSAVTSAMRATVAAVVADAPIFDVMSMEQVLRRVNWLPTFWSRMFGALAVMSLLIAGVGVYGYTAYTVSARSYEFAIRVALGAAPASVVRLVARGVVILAVSGVLIGLPCAWLVSGSLATMLENVSARDPIVYGAVTLFLSTVLLVAAYLPARRAANADPLETLRTY
ncbi:MAG: ABC transporter permease [Bacteroidales bacterium]